MKLVRSVLERWRTLVGSDVSSLSTKFRAHGWVHVPSFIDRAALQHLRNLWTILESSALRKEIIIEHNNISSARRMFTVSAVIIDRATREVDEIYRSPEILDLLKRVTGETIEPMEDEIEKYVFNWLANKGDLHGAHVDSFPYSCSYALFSPPADQGGNLVISKNYEEAQSLQGETFALASGDLFFFRSDTLFHQVSPLLADTNRVVLNMGYATPATKRSLSYSRKTLYSE